MKTLIFSDTHLTEYFDKKRYDFLVEIINESDKVIINGDFWDSIVCSLDDFVSSQWSGLFPLLKSKKSIFIYGNHDPKNKWDERVHLFSVEQKYSHIIFLNKTKLIIEHGDRINGDFNTRFPWIKNRFDFLYKIFFRAYTSRFKIIKSTANYLMKKDKDIAQKEMIKKFQEIHKYDKSNKQIYILSHTHIQLDNRENGFITIGAISQYRYQYATINDKDENIKLFYKIKNN